MNVADLFFGSVWNIAWAGAALGALTGGLTGWWAQSIREEQERRHQQLLENARRKPFTEEMKVIM